MSLDLLNNLEFYSSTLYKGTPNIDGIFSGVLTCNTKYITPKYILFLNGPTDVQTNGVAYFVYIVSTYIGKEGTQCSTNCCIQSEIQTDIRTGLAWDYFKFCG